MPNCEGWVRTGDEVKTACENELDLQIQEEDLLTLPP